MLKFCSAPIKLTQPSNQSKIKLHMHHKNVAHLCYCLPSPFFVSLHLIFDAIFFPNYSLTMYVLLLWLPWKIFQSCYCTISGKLQVLCSVLFSTCMWSHSLRVNQVGKSWLLLFGFQWFVSVITHNDNKSVNTWHTLYFTNYCNPVLILIKCLKKWSSSDLMKMDIQKCIITVTVTWIFCTIMNGFLNEIKCLISGYNCWNW